MTETPPNGSARRFCLVFLALTILWPIAAVFFVRSSLYERLSMDKSDMLVDFYLNFRNQQFDVVVFGDSSGVFGVDPSIIRATTGLTALNLCQTTDILASHGTAALDFYLAHNSRPALLALYLAPPSASIDPDAENEDGIKDRIRHGSLHSLPGLFGAHPVRVLQTLLVMSLVTWRGLFHSAAAGEFQGDALRAVEKAHSGYIPNFSVGLLRDGCSERTGAKQNWKRHDFIDRFRKTYSSLGIPIVVVPGPVADCDRSLEDYQRVLGGVFDSEPYSIPHSLISDDGASLHPVSPAAAGISGRVAMQIQLALGTAGVPRK
jgi:hypothetical protein